MLISTCKNDKYEKIELKEEIIENKDTLKNVLKLIPANEIKAYLLSPKGDSVNFDVDEFEEYFCQYLPKQDYEYYYNNLYNILMMDYNDDEMIKQYFSKVKQYITNLDFSESFKIIKATINAYKDSDKINKDVTFIDNIAVLGMYLRVIYRKSDDILKNTINEWIGEIRDNDFYYNFYLEDILLIVEKMRE